MATVCVAVLLAAGGGSRFHGVTHKLLGEMGAKPLYRWALDSAVEAAVGRVLVVTGAVALRLPGTVVEVHNERWADGQMTSLRAGLVAARSLGADRVVVGLADQPFVVPQAWRAVADHPAAIAVATYGGQRANPVGLAADVWDLLPDAGDEGARALMRLQPALVGEVPCEGSPVDIDTIEDVERWSSSTNSP